MTSLLRPPRLGTPPSPRQRPPPLRSPPPPVAKPAPGLIYLWAFSESRNQSQTRSREPTRAQAEEVSPRHPPRTLRAPIPHRPSSGPPHFPGARAREGCMRWGASARFSRPLLLHPPPPRLAAFPPLPVLETCLRLCRGYTSNVIKATGRVRNCDSLGLLITYLKKSNI